MFTKEWVESYPKDIDNNGCWIPKGIRPTSKGYITPQINGDRRTLSRVVLSLYHGVDYDNYDIVSRHSQGCDKACFNPEHIKPGSQGDNNRDAVEHGTHVNTAKESCPKCGGPYHYVKATSRPVNGKTRVTRRCRRCYNESKRQWRARGGK